jgi:hypothetical protein
MKKLFVFFLFLGLVLSCNSNKDEKKTAPKKTHSEKPKVGIPKDIRFDFTAKRLESTFLGKSIEISATLYNDNLDEAYFLTTSCDGEQYSLIFDKSKFELTSLIFCNASYPKLVKIPAKGKYEFQAHFSSKNKEQKIKLGFDFYSVDKSINMSKVSLNGILIRPKSMQTIIWAEEKNIE